MDQRGQPYRHARRSGWIIRAQSRRRFDEITVERINVVEHDGRVRLVIAEQRAPDAGCDEGPCAAGRQRPGRLIFF